MSDPLPYVIDWDKLSPEMQTHGYMESKKDTDAEYLKNGRRNANPLGGAGPFQMTSGTAMGFAQQNPELQKKYGPVHVWPREDVRHLMATNSGAAVDFAQAYHNELEARFPKSKVKQLAAWNWGPEATDSLSDQDIIAGKAPAGVDDPTYGKRAWEYYSSLPAAKAVAPNSPSLVNYDIAKRYPNVKGFIGQLRAAGYKDDQIETAMLTRMRKLGLNGTQMNQALGVPEAGQDPESQLGAKLTQFEEHPFKETYDFLNAKGNPALDPIGFGAGAIDAIGAALGHPTALQQSWQGINAAADDKVADAAAYMGDLVGPKTSMLTEGVVRSLVPNSGPSEQATTTAQRSFGQGEDINILGQNVNPGLAAAYYGPWAVGQAGVMAAGGLKGAGDFDVSGPMGDMGGMFGKGPGLDVTSPEAPFPPNYTKGPSWLWQDINHATPADTSAADMSADLVRRQNQMAGTAPEPSGSLPEVTAARGLTPEAAAVEGAPEQDQAQLRGEVQSILNTPREMRMQGEGPSLDPNGRIIPDVDPFDKNLFKGFLGGEEGGFDASPVNWSRALYKAMGGKVPLSPEETQSATTEALSRESELKLAAKARQLDGKIKNLPRELQIAMKSDPNLSDMTSAAQQRLAARGVIAPEQATDAYVHRTYLDKVSKEISAVWRRKRPVEVVNAAIDGMLRDGEVTGADGADGAKRPVASRWEAQQMLEMHADGKGKVYLSGKKPLDLGDIGGLQRRGDLPQWYRDYLGEVKEGLASKHLTALEVKKLDYESQFMQTLAEHNRLFSAGREHLMSPLDGGLTDSKAALLGELAKAPLLPEVKDMLQEHFLREQVTKGWAQKGAAAFANYEKGVNTLLNSHVWAKKYVGDLMGGLALGPDAFKNVPMLLKELGEQGFNGPNWQRFIKAGGFEGTRLTTADLDWGKSQLKTLASGGAWDPVNSGLAGIEQARGVLGDGLSLPVHLLRASHFLEAVGEGIRTHDPLSAAVKGDMGLWSKRTVMSEPDAVAYSGRYFPDFQHAKEVLAKGLGDAGGEVAGSFFYVSYPIELATRILPTMMAEKPLHAAMMVGALEAARRASFALAGTTREQVAADRPISDKGTKLLWATPGQNSNGDILLADAGRITPGFNMIGGMFQQDPRLGTWENIGHNILTSAARYVDADVFPDSGVDPGEAYGLSSAQLAGKVGVSVLGGAPGRQIESYLRTPLSPVSEENTNGRAAAQAFDVPLVSGGNTGHTRRMLELKREKDELQRSYYGLEGKVRSGEITPEEAKARALRIADRMKMLVQAVQPPRP